MSEIKPSNGRRLGVVGVQIIESHVNVDQELIQITEDKLRLILKDHLASVALKGDWIAPVGVFVSVLTTFCTAKFDSFIGLGPDFWKALFALVGLFSVGWFCITLSKRRKVMTLDAFINKVKNKST